MRSWLRDPDTRKWLVPGMGVKRWFLLLFLGMGSLGGLDRFLKDFTYLSFVEKGSTTEARRSRSRVQSYGRGWTFCLKLQKEAHTKPRRHKEKRSTTAIALHREKRTMVDEDRRILAPRDANHSLLKQRSNRPVRIDPSDHFDLRSRDGLTVRDNGQGLKARLRQSPLIPRLNELLNHS